ncbi:hypothetical protein Pmani_028459 [Petrolisthes manimaculis]|uniref:Uncharacterized protein n=1 Tax=Petrolisthes manimaculis TaxID=1843537 RepID=A0AAE1P228_9EUCA|nr:hypothetical protein Pmani_028459 [Petrolisthes manimaculis]
MFVSRGGGGASVVVTLATTGNGDASEGVWRRKGAPPLSTIPLTSWFPPPFSSLTTSSFLLPIISFIVGSSVIPRSSHGLYSKSSPPPIPHHSGFPHSHYSPASHPPIPTTPPLLLRSPPLLTTPQTSLPLLISSPLPSSVPPLPSPVPCPYSPSSLPPILTTPQSPNVPGSHRSGKLSHPNCYITSSPLKFILPSSPQSLTFPVLIYPFPRNPQLR